MRIRFHLLADPSEVRSLRAHVADYQTTVNASPYPDAVCVDVCCPTRLEEYLRLLEWLTEHNRRYFLEVEEPPLYQAGVNYLAEPEGWEEWVAAPIVLRRRHGDCDDLACFRAGELRAGRHEAPNHASVTLESERNRAGGRDIHALVRLEDGTLEDPSEILGM